MLKECLASLHRGTMAILDRTLMIPAVMEALLDAPEDSPLASHLKGVLAEIAVPQ